MVVQYQRGADVGLVEVEIPLLGVGIPYQVEGNRLDNGRFLGAGESEPAHAIQIGRLHVNRQPPIRSSTQIEAGGISGGRRAAHALNPVPYSPVPRIIRAEPSIENPGATRWIVWIGKTYEGGLAIEVH